MHIRAALAVTALAAAPSAALACGGLFCNTSQPVNQSAERILFAVDDDHVDMHVRISYAGPPTDFGWLLPVPPGVETSLSSEQLFSVLDQRFGPVFQLNRDFGDRCAVPDFAAAGGGAEDGDGGPGRGVQVLSREAVGPYDRTILEATNVADLRAWLDENDYQIPEDVDGKLQPYIDAGAVFVALKLLPGAESGDVQPVRIRFPGAIPAVPILPTAVAADPDMGIIVHVLGQVRAVPVNYKHVQINESAIDWLGGGQNYADVVSQAADEAGGQAFTTDFAGPHNAVQDALPDVADATVDLIRLSQTASAVGAALQQGGIFADADIARILDSALELPEGLNAATWLQCPDCYGDEVSRLPVDGAAVASRIEAEVNVAREPLRDLFSRMDYLTRLYSTMSPAEMTADPTFDFNGDLADVANVRTATLYLTCDDGGGVVGQVLAADAGGSVRIAEDGSNPRAIRREGGRTVRGQGVPAAAVVEQLLTAGQPEVEVDRRPEIDEDDDDTGGSPAADEGCQAVGGPAVAPVFVLLLAGLWRRRR